MGTASLILLLGLNLVLLALVVTLLRRSSGSSQSSELTQLARESASLRESLTQKFSWATADMATRLEDTKGDLRQQVTDRLGDGFSLMRNAVEEQMKAGRQEQGESLAGARTELTSSLALTTSQLKAKNSTV